MIFGDVFDLYEDCVLRDVLREKRDVAKTSLTVVELR